MYFVDLDHDGRAEETGSLGLGVIVGYEFDEVGPHRILLTVSNEEGRLTVERTVVVNDPEALELVAMRREVIEGVFGGLTIDPAEMAVYASAPLDDLLLKLDPSDLTVNWRLSLSIDDVPHRAGGVATSQDGGSVYVDVGDSLVRIDVSGNQPGPLERFARADRGAVVERLPNGDLLAGGGDGALIIDDETGEIVAESEHFASPDLEASPDGRVAILGGCCIRLLSSNDLSELWRIPFVFNAYSAHFSETGDLLFVLIRTSEEWVLTVVETDSGTVERRYRLERAGSHDMAHWNTGPTALTADGRFVVFATDVGALVVDGVTGEPHSWEVSGALDPKPTGCCNVVSTMKGLLFASGIDGRLTRLRIDQ